MQDPFYRKENVFFETIDYTYNENGDFAERIITDYKGKIKSKSLFEYKNNNIRERIQYGPNELFLHKAIIFADDKGRDTLCVVYDKEGNLTNKYTMVHDEVGIKEEVSYNNNSVVSRKVRINDDADRREYLVYDAAELRSRFIEVYRDNRLVEEITKNEDDLYIYNNYEVTLDYVMSSSHFDRRRRHFFYDNGLTKEVIQYGLDDKLENLTITEYERWE